MSFESGRKLSLTGSLIEIIMPVIMVIALVFFILSVFANLSAAINGSNPFSPYFSSTYLLFLAILVLSGIITFLGVILFIVGMHHLSRYYNDAGIFTNALYGFILNIIGGAATIILYFVLILTTTLNTSQTTPLANTIATQTQFIFESIAVFAITFIIGIISAIFYQRAFNQLAEKSGNNNFKTAGLLYLLGEILTIVLIGPLLLWIAWIMAAIGFNSLKPKEPTPPTFTYTMSPYPPPPPPT